MVHVATPSQANIDPRTFERLKEIIKPDSSLKQIEEAAEALRRM